MKLTAKIGAVEHKSIEKPKMKHLRIGGKLGSMQKKMEDDPDVMYEYIDEIYTYIKDTFPKVRDEDIDNMPTEKFMELVGDIAQWANGGHTGEQKKN
ncbi:MAG: hypothetical protein AB1Z23_03370 [Eubacteriales bacterium]